MFYSLTPSFFNVNLQLLFGSRSKLPYKRFLWWNNFIQDKEIEFIFKIKKKKKKNERNEENKVDFIFWKKYFTGFDVWDAGTNLFAQFIVEISHKEDEFSKRSRIKIIKWKKKKLNLER